MSRSVRKVSSNKVKGSGKSKRSGAKKGKKSRFELDEPMVERYSFQKKHLLYYGGFLALLVAMALTFGVPVFAQDSGAPDAGVPNASPGSGSGSDSAGQPVPGADAGSVPTSAHDLLVLSCNAEMASRFTDLENAYHTVDLANALDRVRLNHLDADTLTHIAAWNTDATGNDAAKKQAALTHLSELSTQIENAINPPAPSTAPRIRFAIVPGRLPVLRVTRVVVTGTAPNVVRRGVQALSIVLQGFDDERTRHFLLRGPETQDKAIALEDFIFSQLSQDCQTLLTAQSGPASQPTDTPAVNPSDASPNPSGPSDAGTTTPSPAPTTTTTPGTPAQ